MLIARPPFIFGYPDGSSPGGEIGVTPAQRLLAVGYSSSIVYLKYSVENLV